MIQNIFINERKLIVNKNFNINNVLNRNNGINKNIQTYNSIKQNNYNQNQIMIQNTQMNMSKQNFLQNTIPLILDIKYNIPYLDRCIKEVIVEENNNLIPKNIFQTWHTLELPTYMRKNNKLLQELNPEFNYYLYDDRMCRNFIIEYFDRDTLYAFDTLLPGAYKSDLWRLCILYVYGGIYLDIKYVNAPNFKFINMIHKEYFVRDHGYGIYQALLICLPKNEILMKCINHIIYNVKNKLYLNNALEITGPQLMCKYFVRHQINNLEVWLSHRGILYNNIPILCGYPEYSMEQKRNELFPHYSIMWNNKNVYKIENVLIQPDNIILIKDEQEHTPIPDIATP